MSDKLGTTGLILNEPLVWERGKPGRTGFSMPSEDVPFSPLAEELVRNDLDWPDLSEVDVVRHYTRLSTWNVSVDAGMYPLGSCTMKYNPKTNERQAGLVGLSDAHPLLPAPLCQGALKLMANLEADLAEITGMNAVSLQPAAGAHGELAGMLIIHACLEHRGERRSKIIIPDTAHGTNPASAALCGYRPVPVKSGPNGILSPDAVKAVMDRDTAGIMITNPNTLGLFEENIREISEIVHFMGGLVYADGANFNAVMGVVNMGCAGVDVMHLNLHKTFSTPHGGGGPGSGPVCVQKHLEPFLPVPRIVMQNGAYGLSRDFPLSIGRLVTFYGHFSVMVRAFSYIRSLGPEGLARASQLAVLNANYIRERLKAFYHLAYDRPCMHECVFSDKKQQAHKISTLDIAKRLMDYGYHPPTIYFPLVVPGALMIEPTETESRDEIDQFVDALIAIAKEAEENPDLLHDAPKTPKMRRLNEVEAARKPCLAG